jgi:hypothetical protein
LAKGGTVSIKQENEIAALNRAIERHDEALDSLYLALADVKVLVDDISKLVQAITRSSTPSQKGRAA